MHHKYLQEETKTVDEITQKILDGKTYAQVVSVASSGMSRRIKFYQVVDGEIVNVSEAIANVTEDKYDRDKGILVRGCGMDMVFATLYNYLMAKGYKHSDRGQEYKRL